MKKNTQLLAILAVGAVMALASCGGSNTPASSAPASQAGSQSASQAGSQSASQSAQQTSEPVQESSKPAAQYVRENDEDVYDRQLGGFAAAYDGVKSIQNNNERYVKYAKAEAELLNSGVFAPTTTNGGAYAITRIAPRTVPYVFYGNDSDKLKNVVLTAGNNINSFITGEQRAELLELWKKAAGGEGTYDPAAYLTSKGFTLGREFADTTSAAPATKDPLATSKQVDTEEMVNCIEGLVQYNNLGVLVPALAESWTVSNDGTKYSFTIREGASWFTADKAKYADVKAQDFVDGFHHMLDAGSGLEELLYGVVKGVEEYVNGTGEFSDVGVYVDDQGKLIYELEAPESYFLSRLTYSCFLPMNKTFFESHGGVFGPEFSTVAAGASYTYGKTITDQLYNSAFVPTTWDLNDTGGSIVLVRNEKYWDNEKTTLDKLSWIYDDGKNPIGLYNSTINGSYPAIGLGESSGLLAKAKEDGYFDKYHYISDTDATTFFGGINLNRGCWEVGSAVSSQTEEEKILTHEAVQSANFRKAILHAWDRGAWNALSRGGDLKFANIRNMYTQPDFVSLDADVVVDGKTYKQGSSYGELVQSFLDDANAPISVADGADGWYNEEAAKACIQAAKTELGDKWPAGKKVAFDLVYYSGSTTQVAQSAAFEQTVEAVIGDYVDVRLVEATTTADYYYSGYYAATGADLNQDIFYGSGWGPDYGDPSTYLDTFTETGYMTKVIGLF